MNCETTVRNVAYYIFAHLMLSGECYKVNKSKKTTEGNKKWKYVRCTLEKLYNLEKTKAEYTKTIANNVYLPCNSFIQGCRMNDFLSWRERHSSLLHGEMKYIDDDYFIAEGEFIVIIIKPMPLGFEFYEPAPEHVSVDITRSTNITPEKSGTSWIDRYGTEEEALEAFMIHESGPVIDSSKNNSCPRDIKQHASVFGTRMMLIPRGDYVCWNCWEKGHYRRFCQQIGQTDICKATEVIKKTLPKGIPMDNFVKVDYDPHMTGMGIVIYHDRDGNWYREKEKK